MKWNKLSEGLNTHAKQWTKQDPGDRLTTLSSIYKKKRSDFKYVVMLMFPKSPQTEQNRTVTLFSTLFKA